MPFQFHLDILDWIFKGMLIGIVASAPMGPVGVLCIQRTLNKGRWYGFVTGVGATVSDFIYALVTGFGMSFVMDLVNNTHNRFILQITGSVMLMAFGIYCYRSDPTKKIHVSGNKKGTLIHNGVTAFLVTFSNPLIIFLFMAAYAQFAFVVPKHPLHMCVGYFNQQDHRQRGYHILADRTRRHGVQPVVPLLVSTARKAASLTTVRPYDTSSPHTHATVKPHNPTTA